MKPVNARKWAKRNTGVPAGAGFAVILTAMQTAVGTTAGRHSRDGCVPGSSCVSPARTQACGPKTQGNADARDSEATWPSVPIQLFLSGFLTWFGR